jgi:MOSC domain-containing protein YiiM
MRLVSVNIGLPRKVNYKGKVITTGIFKQPVDGRVPLRPYNLDGDRQADLSVHGGPSKAVYVYPAEHYDFWRAELGDWNLTWGMFGENFTTMALFEHSVHVGDRLAIGTAEVRVTEPRLPCYKLGVKFGRDDIVKKFLRSRRTGFYLAVVKAGEVGAGDAIEILGRAEDGVSIAEFTATYLDRKNDPASIMRVLEAKHLAVGWRDYFVEQLAKVQTK